MITSLFRAVAVIAALSVPTAALSQIQLVPVVSGLSSPVFVGNADDSLNRLFIVEQAGVIKVLQPGDSEPTVFLDIRARILAGGERGLLGLAFHPQYVSNGRFFVFYTRAGDGALVIAEYAASPPNSNTASSAEKVLLTIPHPGFSNHNGGMLAFGGDGFPLHRCRGWWRRQRSQQQRPERQHTAWQDPPHRRELRDEPTRHLRITRSSARSTDSTRSLPTASAIPGDSASIAQLASCGSVMSARALARKSILRSRAVATTAGPTSRETCARRRVRTRTSAPCSRIISFPSLITNTSAAAVR